MKKIVKFRIKWGSCFLVIIALLVILGIYIKDHKKVMSDQVMPALIGSSVSVLDKYNDTFDITKEYDYNNDYEKDIIFDQSISEGSKYNKGDKLVIKVSKGKIDYEKLASDKINELGKVPIMMYHGIENIASATTKYTGGNIDKEGYNRTSEAFRNDLEMYYQKGYRMIRLEDYINGNIDTEYGKSPIVLTFDDGNANNIKVTGLDDDNNIIIDPNCAVGILEEFKKKYKDYNVTATFFVNGGLFNQEEYNYKIITWLIEHGYDIGNHTNTHINIGKSDEDTIQKEIGIVYQKLDEIIPDKYVKIIALPFGSPYQKDYEYFKYVFDGVYENKQYHTESALRVGWEPEVSPYDNSFDKTYLKRCRAYDNNGKDFDIESVFKNLEYNKYISDGNKNTIVVSETYKDKVNTNDKEIIVY